MKVTLILLILLSACSSEPAEENNTPLADMGSDSGNEGDLPKPVVPTTNKIENSWKFVMREPRKDVLDCGGITYSDQDWLCTFDYDGMKSVLYFQNSPEVCTEVDAEDPPEPPSYGSIFFRQMLNSITRYSDVKYRHEREVREGSEIEGAVQNDSLTISYGLKKIKYYHSSFGADLNKCQSMDCLQVFDEEGNIETNGCLPDRSLPIVCIPVESGSKYNDDSLKDSFMKCAGDTL